MKTAVVFGNGNSIDFLEIRSHVCRIPEVSLKLEEAQTIWDKECAGELSLVHFLNSENNTFFNNINVKSLALAVIQIGLFDRYVRKNEKPHFLIGDTQNDAALMVCSGQKSLEELIRGSQACSLLRPAAPLQMVGEIFLKGQKLPSYEVFSRVFPVVKKAVNTHGDGVNSTDNETLLYHPIGVSAASLDEVIRMACEKENVSKVIYVGPGGLPHRSIMETNMDLQWLDSIDLDPMLNWFWSDIRKLEINAI
jgi:hypothetical protein